MKKFPIILIAAVIPAAILLNSCGPKIPLGVQAVQNFDAEKYLGKWYEIARMDYKFERNLEYVTANYSLKENGDIKVLNKGFNIKKNKWEEAEGKAKPYGKPNEGKLKVSFFGPFYAGYNVIAIDENYQYALVIGDKTKYAWILSRTPTIPEDVKADYLIKAKKAGVKTDEFIWVNHSVNKPN